MNKQARLCRICRRKIISYWVRVSLMVECNAYFKSGIKNVIPNGKSGCKYYIRGNVIRSSDSIWAVNNAGGIEIHPLKYIPECHIIRVELALFLLMSHNLCHACSLRFARDVAVITPSRRSALTNRTLLMSDENIDEVLETIVAPEVTAGQSRSLAMALALQEYR